MNSKFLPGAVASLVLLSACGGGGMTPADTSRSAPAAFAQTGFLSDYSRLTAVSGIDGTFRYIDNSANLRPYNKVMIDPVQIFLSPNPEYKGLQPDALQRMAETFRTAFAGALLSGYQVVQTPGPDVIRLRLAITGVQAVKPDRGVTDFIPIKAVFNVARSAAGAAPQVAEMSAEMELLDPSGKVVGAAVSSRKSDKTVAQGERITWKELDPIAGAWAKNLRTHLDYARGYAAK